MGRRGWRGWAGDTTATGLCTSTSAWRSPPLNRTAPRWSCILQLAWRRLDCDSSNASKGTQVKLRRSTTNICEIVKPHAAIPQVNAIELYSKCGPEKYEERDFRTVSVNIRLQFLVQFSEWNEENPQEGSGESQAILPLQPDSIVVSYRTYYLHGLRLLVPHAKMFISTIT